MAANLNNVLEAVKALDAKDRYKVAMALFAAPAEKAKKVRDPNTPKKEMGPNNFVGFQHRIVMPHIKVLAVEEGISEEDRKHLADIPTRSDIASMLWKSVAAADRETITLEQVRETFGRWKVAPPERKPKAEKPTTADAVAARPKRTLTDEQKAKMKAGKEAAKARKAAEAAGGGAAPIPALAESEPEEEVEAVELVDWEHDFGTGAKLYKRLNYEGGIYIYEAESRKYLGAYVEKTNKLKKSVADPLAPEDD